MLSTSKYNDTISLYAVDDVPYHAILKTTFKKRDSVAVTFVPMIRVNTTSNKKEKVRLNGSYGDFEDVFKRYSESGDIAISVYVTNQVNGNETWYKTKSVENCLKALNLKYESDALPKVAAVDGPFRDSKGMLEQKFPGMYFIGKSETPTNYYKFIEYVGRMTRAVVNNRLVKLGVPMKNTDTIFLESLKNKDEVKEFRKVLNVMNDLNVHPDLFLVDREIEARFVLKGKYCHNIWNNGKGDKHR